MTPAEMLLWRRAQQRAAGMQPDIAAAILRAFQIIRDSLSEAELIRIIASGNVDSLFAAALSDAVLDRAFMPVRERIRLGLARQVRISAADLPRRGKINGSLAIRFDYLNPRVIEGIRKLESKVVDGLADDTKDAVRAYVENGLRDGVNPRVIGRDLRGIIGLAPNQVTAVSNFERALVRADGASSPFDYQLRDKRFDAAIRKGDLSPEQVDRMVTAYEKRFTAWNAETNSRTASLDAQRLSVRLSWQDAIDKGIVPGDQLEKTWRGVMDNRERPEHVAMEGETVPFDQPFSNGQMIPGDTEYNCRCVPIYRIAA